jgi:hypothetical protein
MGEIQICDLEFTVIRISSVPAEDENVGRFNVLMPADGKSISADVYQIGLSVPTH